MQKSLNHLDKLNLMGENLKWFGLIAGFLNLFFYFFLIWTGMKEALILRLLTAILLFSFWFYRHQIFQEIVFFIALPLLFTENYLLNLNSYWLASMVFSGIIYGILSNLIFSPILFILFVSLYIGTETIENLTVIAASGVSVVLGFIIRRYFSILQKKIVLQNLEISRMENHKERLKNAGVFVGSVTHQLGNSVGAIKNWHKTALVVSKKNKSDSKLVSILEKMQIPLDYSINIINPNDA